MGIVIKIISFVLISVVIQLSIATVLTLSAMKKAPNLNGKGLDFSELLLDYSNLPRLTNIDARDGKQIAYRYYPSTTETVLILVHGSGWHSEYLLSLAEFISSDLGVHVYTPDLRGHGVSPERRGDIDYIEQLEDDLADLTSYVRKTHPNAKLIVGGHSSGGGLAIRFAGSQYGNQADGYMLLSPFLKYNAPTMRSNSGGWAEPYTGRIIGLSMFNMMGIHQFDYLPAISFNMPEKVRNGSETLQYSYRLNTGYAPRNYKKDLLAINQPVLILAGTDDEAFIAQEFEPTVLQYVDAQAVLLKGVSHMGAVVSSDVQPVIRDWFEDYIK